MSTHYYLSILIVFIVVWFVYYMRSSRFVFLYIVRWEIMKLNCTNPHCYIGHGIVICDSLVKNLLLCETWGSYNTLCLPGCDVLLGKLYLMFQRIVVFSSIWASTLHMKALWSFKISETARLVTASHSRRLHTIFTFICL